MNNKIIISNNMRAKDKMSFFAMHQIYHKIKAYKPDVDVQFHINWGHNTMGGSNVKDTEYYEAQSEENKKWSALIQEHFGHCLTDYNRDFLKNYVKKAYGYDDDGKFQTYDAIYMILLPHYLRRVLMEEYYLIYDNDILINCDFHEITDAALQHIPVLISEPANAACDKVLHPGLFSIYPNGKDIYLERNPNGVGFNGGFQGIDLAIYDDFLSTDRFVKLLGLFDYRGTFDENGNEIWGDQRFLIETQQQSFFGLMNVMRSRLTPHILSPMDYFVVPNFGKIDHPKHGKLDREDGVDGWGLALKSKITHFIGHTQGKGKPQIFQERMNMYLKEHGFLE
ncbi:MAG TPA: hypothetical protein DCX54_02850 [Flavobacteriales bacterium]|nr:hypothetical protein [Flavobacteriales bacterium]